MANPRMEIEDPLKPIPIVPTPFPWDPERPPHKKGWDPPPPRQLKRRSRPHRRNQSFRSHRQARRKMWAACEGDLEESQMA
jgi:hypothetical protein